jgi:A/G-specific adenine glycosylase
MPAAKKEIHARQTELTPGVRAGDYAQAMMDLGAAICTPKKPPCALCPISHACAARAEGRQEEYPVRGEKSERPMRRGAAFVAVRPDGAVLLRTRPDRGLLGGMTEVPGTTWAADYIPSAGDAPFPADWRAASEVAHVFTHFRLELNVFCAHVGAMEKAPPGSRWAPAATLADEALPSVMKKAIEAALPGVTKRPVSGKRAA